jgi:hypothetical protein
MITTMPESDSMEFEVAMKLDLMSFIHRCFVELNPGQELSFAPYIEVMASKVAACLSGRGPKRRGTSHRSRACARGPKTK